MSSLGPMAETTFRPHLRVDLRLTLWPLRRGYRDPSWLEDGDGSWWRAFGTSLGPASARYHTRPADREVRVQAWGPGAEAAVAGAPDLLGGRDSLDGFEPPPGLVRDLHRRRSGLRLTWTGAVFPSLVPTVLEQKVTGRESRRSYAAIVRAWGEPAPGPAPLLVPPDAATLAAKQPYEFHPFGIEARRANTIRHAAARATRLEEAAAMAPADARRRLEAFPGVGAWTAAEVALFALADADAVSIGDFHLPNMVSWALAGEPRGTDERMLELLEPYAGHRGRVLRLLAAGGIEAPRYGPRKRIRSIASI